MIWVEKGEGGREDKVFIVKECLDLQDLFLPYSLPLPPELLGTDKLFGAKGLITDASDWGHALGLSCRAVGAVSPFPSLGSRDLWLSLKAFP